MSKKMVRAYRSLFIPIRTPDGRFKRFLGPTELSEAYSDFRSLLERMRLLSRLREWEDGLIVDLYACIMKLAIPGERFAYRYLTRLMGDREVKDAVAQAFGLKKGLDVEAVALGVREALLNSKAWLVPSDTRPGANTSSLLVHMVSCSAVASSAMPGRTELRLACLLHDAGKALATEGWPQYGHVSRSVEWLRTLPIKHAGKAADIVERHHKGGVMSEYDRASSAWDRLKEVVSTTIGGRLADAYGWTGDVKELVGRLYVRTDGEVLEFWNRLGDEEYKELSEEFVRGYWRLSLEGRLPAAWEGGLGDCILLMVDARGIKKYVDGSCYLREMKGGSRNVDRACMEIAYRIAEIYGAENVIYAGGGNVLAVASKSMVETIREEVLRVEESYGIGFHMSYIGFGAGWFGAVWRKLLRKASIEKLSVGGVSKPVIPGAVRICSSCGLKPATSVVKDEYYCESCKKKYFEGESMVKELLKRSVERGSVLKVERVSGSLPDFVAGTNLSVFDVFLGEDGLKIHPMDLAVIKADGNLMGFYIGTAGSLTDLVERSCRVHYAMERVREAVRKLPSHLGVPGEECYDVRLDVGLIYCEGDDICWLVPGWMSPYIALRIAETFHEYMGGACTMSIAIVCFNPKYPVYEASSLAGRLLSEVKARRRNDMFSVYSGLAEGVESEIVGFVDYEDVSVTPVGPHGLERLRRTLTSRQLTLRPYTIYRKRSNKPDDYKSLITILTGSNIGQDVPIPLSAEGVERLKTLRRALSEVLHNFKFTEAPEEKIREQRRLAVLYILRQTARKGGEYPRVLELLRPEAPDKPFRLLDGHILLRILGADVEVPRK